MSFDGRHYTCIRRRCCPLPVQQSAAAVGCSALAESETTRSDREAARLLSDLPYTRRAAAAGPDRISAALRAALLERGATADIDIAVRC